MWHIAKKDLQILFRDIPGLIYLFLTPILVIAVASFALGGVFGSSPTKKFEIPVVVEDSGQAAKDMVEALKKVEALDLKFMYEENGKEQQMTRDKADELVRDKKAAIIIPKGFSEAVTGGKEATIQIIQNPTDQVIPGVIKNVVSEYISKLSTAIVANQVGTQAVQSFASTVGQQHNLKLDPTPEISKIQEYIKQYTAKPPIKYETKNLESKGSAPTTFDYNVPGYAVMFVLLGATSAASVLLEERENGTLRKLKTLPISSHSILLGKMLSSFITASIQCLVLFAVGYLGFGMNLGGSILGLLLMIVSTAFAATGLSMLLAAFCKTRSQASGVSILLVLAMSALGGSWWPLYIEPVWMQKIAHITLTAWSTGGFSDLLVYGKGLVDILLPAGVLLGMGLLFLTIAIRRFRFE
ncbi:ABC transporter permease [Croceifilum oryzae]|nr:ABC transporter permease [Croceifilum oryzae]